MPFPADLFTTRAGEGTPRGEVFASADGRARLHLFAFANERNESPAQFIARVIVDDRRKLTYQRVARDFFVFSAPEDDRVLYRRCNFSRDRMIHCVDLRYPRAEKRAFDGLVTRMSLRAEAAVIVPGPHRSNQCRRRQNGSVFHWRTL